jgi:hypothetical protein
MAAEHQIWIADIFSELFPAKDVRELMRLLAKTKGSAQKVRAEANAQRECAGRL